MDSARVEKVHDMKFPSGGEWAGMSAGSKVRAAADLVVEAYERRHPDARTLTYNEERAVETLMLALEDLGYELRPPDRWHIWRRKASV